SGVPPDPDARVGGLETACAAGQHRACTYLSYLYSDEWAASGIALLQPGFAIDLRRANDFARTGCDLGNPVACWNLGISYDLGEGVREDWFTAHKLTAKACSLGMPMACDEIGWESYWQAGDPEDELSSACAAGDPSACFYLAGVRYADDADEAAYRISLRDTCIEGGISMACGFEAAFARLEGDFLSARQFARAGCETGDGNACVTLGNLYDLGQSVTRDQAHATQLFKQACDLEEAIGCFNWGNMQRAGSGVQKDVIGALDAYVLACDMRYSDACDTLLKILDSPDGYLAEGYLQAACDQGSDNTCDVLSTWMQ
ncbi:MAG: tetratricopeptide repeat protein, partial [Paracoccaceae bacterium]